jgi:hypothetical protein
MHRSSPRRDLLGLGFVALALSTAGITACGGGGKAGPEGPGEGSGPATGGSVTPLPKSASVCATDARPYPSEDNQGYQHRRSSVAGNTLIDFALQGYADSDRSKGLGCVTMQDFYDPTGEKNIKLLHISVGAAWCGPCQAEAMLLVPKIAEFRAKGVVFVSVLAQRPDRMKAEPVDLDHWIDTFKTNYTQVLDPGAEQFGPFFDGSSYPLNINVDARSMEILTAAPGTADLLAEVNTWLDWVNTHPPTATK